jgi:DNA-binding transcriptional regulator GbsR (MarR family)
VTPEPLRLTPAQLRFVEQMGLQFEAAGVPRIGGRIFGLMLLAPRPVSIEEAAAVLKVSRASVSVLTRLGQAIGALEPASIAGDRRRYWVFSDRYWDHRLDVGLKHAASLRTLAQEGLESIDPKATHARERLAQVVAFSDVLEDALNLALRQWRARRIA